MKEIIIKNKYGKSQSWKDDGKIESRRENLAWGNIINIDGEINKKIKWILIKDIDNNHLKKILKGGYADNDPVYKEALQQEINYRRDIKIGSLIKN